MPRVLLLASERVPRLRCDTMVGRLDGMGIRTILRDVRSCDWVRNTGSKFLPRLPGEGGAWRGGRGIASYFLPKSLIPALRLVS